MSQKKARQKRRDEGWVRHQTQPTAILEAAYIQAPVGYDAVKRAYIYRSPSQVRAYLKRRGVDVETLAVELELLMGELEAKAATVL